MIEQNLCKATRIPFQHAYKQPVVQKQLLFV